jgi:hypothetical protein
MRQSHDQSNSGEPPKSLPLFSKKSSVNAAPGTLNDDSMVRAIITNSIKRSSFSREAIAERMSELLGLSVTARMITSFTAESKELHRWPGAWDRAFCAAVDDDTLLKCRAEAAGYQLIRDEEIQLLELGRQYLRRKRAAEETDRLEACLRSVDL